MECSIPSLPSKKETWGATNGPVQINISAVTQNRFVDTISDYSLEIAYFYRIRAENIFGKLSDKSDPSDVIVMDGVITIISPDNLNYYCDEILVKANMRVLTNNTSVTLQIGAGENPLAWLSVTNFQGWERDNETNVYYFDIKKYDGILGWQIGDGLYRLRLKASSADYYHEDNVKLKVDRIAPYTEISNWQLDINSGIYYVNYTRLKLQGYDPESNNISSGLKEIRYGFDTNNYYLYVPGNLVLDEGI